jgi:hypothetical protein
MPEFSREIHGVLVRVTLDEAHAPQADGFFQILESLPPSAVTDGQIIEAGWGYLRPVAQPDGSVVLTAPDHAGATPDWVSDLSTEAWVLAEQVSMIRKLGVDPKECRASDHILVEEGALEAAEVYFHRRKTSRDGDSGWFLGIAEPGDRGEMDWVIAYSLLQSRRELIPFLMLPDEYMVFLSGSEVKGVSNAKNKEIWS